MSKIEKNGESVTITPGIDIVASKCSELKEEFLTIINDNPKQIIIDLSGTEMIDSSGLGLLISTRNSLADAGGDEVKLTNISTDIMQLFKVMRLDNHFTIET